MNNNKIYFQDNPVNDYKYDYVGFEEQVRMIKEGIESEDTKIIGLISDYGSGKSSIIELLKNDLGSDYDIININLLDPDDKINGLESHKRMLLQIANHMYKNDNSNKLSYIVKRLNPNYKSIDITTKNKISNKLIILSIFLLIINFLYKNEILKYLNFLSFKDHETIISFLKNLANISGVIGFLILFFIIVKNNIVFNYFKKDNETEINEFDLIEVSKELINKNKTTIIIIEDLDRVSQKNIVEQFIKELNIYYSVMNDFKFIVSITPDKFLENNSENVDSKYKPFNMVINLSNIKNSDYDVILKQLLLSKEELLNEELKINIKDTLYWWSWLAFGKKLNIRRLKHRINDTLHLYLTLKNRFKDKYIELKTCIAIAYLKDEYEIEYMNLIKEENDEQFKLKTKIEEYITNQPSEEGLSGIDLDLFNLIKSGYIDYNCEIYCFNYSKLNRIFDVNENEIVNKFIYDKKYNLDNEQIKRIILNNPDFLKEAVKKRISLGAGLPNNIFERTSIINFILQELSEKELYDFFEEKLLIDIDNIEKTTNRLKTIYDSNFFNEDNLIKYINFMSKHLMENEKLNSMETVRLKLIDVFENNLVIMKPLYMDEFPIILYDEMVIIKEIETIINLTNYDKINLDNIKDFVSIIDLYYKNNDEKYLLNFLENINAKEIDYCFKNLKSLSKINEKETIFYDNFKNINLSSLTDVEDIIKSFEMSFKELEEKVISLLGANIIDINQYRDFVNKLPNVHDCTLERIEKDDYIFKVNDNIINEFYNKDKMYGCIKFKTFKDGKVPDIKKNRNLYLYETMYSNNQNIFDEYIKNSIHCLNYIKDNKIYKRYNDKIYLMSYTIQDLDLLEYVFLTLQNTPLLSDYLTNIKEVKCEDDLLNQLIEKNINNIKGITESAYKSLLKSCKSRSVKSKLGYVRNK